MKSEWLGKNTLEVEVLNISTRGVWLGVVGREFFLPYREFPWFKDASVSQICDVRLVHSRHLFWEELDVDLELGSIEDPKRYPLKTNGGI